MGARVRPIRVGGSALLGVVLLASAPELGWWAFAVYLPPASFLWMIDLAMRRSARPERLVVVASLWSTLTIAAGAALTGGLASPLLPWLVIPALLLATRFRLSVVVAGSLVTVVVAGAAGLAAALLPVAPPAAGWVWFLCFAALLVNVTGVTAAMLSAELTSRAHAAVDPLTGLSNRQALGDRFNDLDERAAGLRPPVSALLIDIDHFKRVNDQHGHDVGDQVLVAVAEALRAHVPDRPVYRLGGEEFLILLEDAGPGAASVAERLRAAVEELLPLGLRVTVSIGCAESAGDDVRQSDLLRRADQALYSAKSAGRNLVVAGPLAATA